MKDLYITAYPQSGSCRPNCAPAYYLGRPASLWIAATGPRRRRTQPSHLAGSVSAGQARPLPPASGLPGAGSETVCVRPITTPLPVSGAQLA